jgi:uncharacterized repeat protein (TIGR03803 family)
VIYNFCSATNCSDGATPYGGLALDAAVNLYGTTYNGGYDNEGTVFQLTPQKSGPWSETVLYRFESGMNGVLPGIDGSNPEAGVVLDSAGNLYGTTDYGYCADGACNNGTVFEVARGQGGQWQETLLYGFHTGFDGSSPIAPLLMDQAGNLYGTTNEGGSGNGEAGGDGVVFALTPAPPGVMWAEAPIYSFQGQPDGNGPTSGLVMDSQGNLYGVAPGGGTNGTGVVFRVTP